MAAVIDSTYTVYSQAQNQVCSSTSAGPLPFVPHAPTRADQTAGSDWMRISAESLPMMSEKATVTQK
jgi:hypothetical protein